jgi:DNA-binding NarL/FixJ family response regulator
MLPHITVIIAHRHLYFRTILQNILQSQSGLCVLAVVSTMVELLEQAMLHAPDIILADIGFTGMDGLSLLAPLTAISKPPKFIFSWQYYEEPLLRALMAAAPANYIVHDAPPSEYDIAIRQVMKGLPYCCAQTERLIVNNTTMLPFDANPMFEFNLKYQLLFYCEDLGYKCKEMALGSGLTEQSVRTYRKRTIQKVGSRGAEAKKAYFKRNRTK